MHRQLCRDATSIWYTGASCRAAEGWSSAVEWVIDSAQSGSKMRGCVGEADALDTELGAIYKAIEGFQELMAQSARDGKAMSHTLIVFCNSQAAIVAIDTSSRPESFRFERLWRDICTEYLRAKLVLAWLPAQTQIEGLTLASRIAEVGSTNSYAKRKKDNLLPDIYRRAGGDDLAPSGSTTAGPWQRGDADPSRRKSPFSRPSPPRQVMELEGVDGQAGVPVADPIAVEAEPEEESGQPKEGSIFVMK